MPEQNRLLQSRFAPGSREWYANRIYGTGVPVDASKQNAQGAEFVASMAPVTGEVISARDAWNSSGKGANALLQGDYGQAAGEYGNMLLGVMGAIPGAGIIARGTKRGAAWMDRNLPQGVNRLIDQVYPQDPQNTLHIFAGPTAKTADKAALAKAQEMAAGGANRDDILRDTGWFKGVDGKWRFEIDDSGARLSNIENLPTAGGIFGDDVPNARFSGLSHDEFTNAYGPVPPITGQYGPLKTTSGQYDPTINKIFAEGQTPEAVRGTTLHELQHAVQTREGFERGTNIENSRDFADAWISEVNDKLRAMARQMDTLSKSSPEHGALKSEYDDLLNQKLRFVTENTGFDLYMRHAGEVEARNVQSRMNMTPAERRAKPPWLTQDMPDEQQIVRSFAGPAGNPGGKAFGHIVDESGNPKNAASVWLTDDERI